MSCEHNQCCLCLKRECQLHRNFKRFAGLMVCGDSCISRAVSLAHKAACMFGGDTEQPCGKKDALSPEVPKP